MMEIRWTSKALSDLVRLHEFLNLMRYEIQHDIIYLLRIWHTREDR